MNSYSIIGTNLEIICASHQAKPHYIKMRDPRPSVNHICREDGTWGVNFTTASKELRDDLVASNLTKFDVVWQVDSTSISFIRSAVDTYEFLVDKNEKLPIDERKSISQHTHWRLADNTVRLTSYSELREVLLDYALRTEDIFRQYNIWYAADHDELFSYTPDYS